MWEPMTAAARPDVYKRQIGSRPIDQHLKGFRALGADVKIEYGFIVANAEKDVYKRQMYERAGRQKGKKGSITLIPICLLYTSVAAVKKTEGQADELLRQAGQDSAEILKEAKAEAEELKAKALEEAKRRAAARMEQAKADGEKLLAEEEEKAVREAAALKSLAARSEEKAVEAVLAALV